jgi:hypothetical protein
MASTAKKRCPDPGDVADPLNAPGQGRGRQSMRRVSDRGLRKYVACQISHNSIGRMMYPAG